MRGGEGLARIKKYTLYIPTFMTAEKDEQVARKKTFFFT